MLKRKYRIDEGAARAGEGAAPPQKRFFRMRAHINPLGICDVYEYRPPFVEIADIGCGFGGLLAGLGPLFPSTLMLGLEIRDKVSEYVRLRILSMRRLGAGGENLSVLTTNAMKLLPHLFFRGQLAKAFFCFPDPHFKKAHVRRRIVNGALLAEYAYVLREGGLLYTITDVKDLDNWMVASCEAHPAFERLSPEEVAADPCVPIMRSYTEEGQKVERLRGEKYYAVFRRLSPERASARLEALTGGDFWTEPTLHYEHRRAMHRGEYHLGAPAPQSKR